MKSKTLTTNKEQELRSRLLLGYFNDTLEFNKMSQFYVNNNFENYS
jgi:hypothetical protein